MLLLLASSLISSVVLCSDFYYVSFSGVWAPRGRKKRHKTFMAGCAWSSRYCWFLHPQPSCTKHNFRGKTRDKIMQVVKHTCTDLLSTVSNRCHDFVVREEIELHSKAW